MRAMDLALCLALPMVILGQVTRLVAAERARSWLTLHDPEHAREGALRGLLSGGVLASWGPLRRYAALRRGRGEDTALVTVFWAGFVVSLCGVALFFGLILRDVPLE